MVAKESKSTSKHLQKGLQTLNKKFAALQHRINLKCEAWLSEHSGFGLSVTCTSGPCGH